MYLSALGVEIWGIHLSIARAIYIKATVADPEQCERCGRTCVRNHDCDYYVAINESLKTAQACAWCNDAEHSVTDCEIYQRSRAKQVGRTEDRPLERRTDRGTQTLSYIDNDIWLFMSDDEDEYSDEQSDDEAEIAMIRDTSSSQTKTPSSITTQEEGGHQSRAIASPTKARTPPKQYRRPKATAGVYESIWGAAQLPPVRTEDPQPSLTTVAEPEHLRPIMTMPRPSSAPMIKKRTDSEYEWMEKLQAEMAEPAPLPADHFLA